ncbi:sugar diacid recognition domain-containing protein [Halobacillus sp. Marseille-Q1614]|uniref:CdaR family transcriptional regulator n=1 Tax=Halobacillus sp. Marseille-Q1614 TaxID=2709134 RepID=UPI001570C7FD|nr:sugar diacid recognition domain-containing protein [Halobacillus sp. Marseille-Q1614]
MELTEQLGREIISRLSKYIDVPINLMNARGKIVASTDPERVGQLHGGARAVIEAKNAQIITEKDVDHFSNAKSGVNLPIFHRGELAGVVGLTGNPDHVMQAARMTQGSVEITLEQMHMQKQAFFLERQWNQWLQQLLHPVKVNLEELEREAKYTLQVDVHKQWQVVIYQSQNAFELADKIRPLLENYDPLFILPYQENTVVVPLPFEGERLLIPNLEGVYIGAGQPGYSIEGIRQSCKQAREAIELAGEKGKVIESESIKTERLLYHLDPDVFREVTDPYVQRLQKLDPSYLETLEHFFENDLKMNQTAEVLHIHRNTLIYRLDQLSKKVGLDPRVFNEAILLKSILTKR